jgi:hypothetical protein
MDLYGGTQPWLLEICIEAHLQHVSVFLYFFFPCMHEDYRI